VILYHRPFGGGISRVKVQLSDAFQSLATFLHTFLLGSFGM